MLTNGQRKPMQGRSRLQARALACLALFVIPLGTPAAVGASPVSQLSPYGSSSLCSGVSPSQVAAVVGHPVPAPTPLTNSSTTMGIIETFTECSYAHMTSLASMEQEVVLAYTKLSKVPAKSTVVAFIKQSMKKAERSQDTKWTYTIGNKFGLTNMLARATSTVAGMPFTLSIAAGWRGDKVAEAVAFGALVPAKIYALEKLAVDNFGL